MQPHVTTREMLNMLIDTGRIFSGGKSFTKIFGDLMDNVRNATGAEGGSLYIYDHHSETLKIVLMRNDPLGINKIVEKFDALKISGFIELPVRIDGAPNLQNPSVYGFLRQEKVLLPSLDDAGEYQFNFVNTRKFDKENNYHTRNLVVLPLFGNNQNVIGVLQLINCNDSVFSDNMQPFIDAVAGQVGIMLSNALLVNETQELMSAIIQMIGVAIDEKSPHTAGHCQRVVALTMMIADALANDDSSYSEFSLTPEQRRELQIAALLHDIGKIITPIHILDKKTKLHTVGDQINLLYERMRAWQLTNELNHLKQTLHAQGLGHLANGNGAAANEDYDFLDSVNKGNTFVDEDTQKRLMEISRRLIETPTDKTPQTLMQEDELSNLQIRRGTLNPTERKIMEDHVSISIRLLSSIPWPSNLSKVVEYAGAHHENMNGTGYPNKLTADDLSLPARVLGLADRFEGLSAPDRPYRSVKMTLSRVMNIMEDMADKDEIDRTLFDFFKNNNLHLKYAEQYLPQELIDC